MAAPEGAVYAVYAEMEEAQGCRTLEKRREMMRLHGDDATGSWVGG